MFRDEMDKYTQLLAQDNEKTLDALAKKQVLTIAAPREEQKAAPAAAAPIVHVPAPEVKMPAPPVAVGNNGGRDAQDEGCDGCCCEPECGDCLTM